MNIVRARGVRAVVSLLMLAFLFSACTQAAPQANSNAVATPSGAATVQTLPQATPATSSAVEPPATEPPPTVPPATAPLAPVPPATEPAATGPTAVPVIVATVQQTTLPDTATLAPTAIDAPGAAATTAVSAASPSGANGGLSDVIIAAQRVLMSTKAYRGRTVTTLTNGATATTTVEFVAPDRFSIAGPAGQDFIVIGTNSWQKGPNTGWQKSAIDMSGLINSFRDPKVINELAKSIATSDVQRLDDDTLNGRPMHVYQYNTAITGGDKAIRGTTKIWIGAGDELPYRMESDQDSLVDTGRTHSIITYDYNSADIKIDAPVMP